MHTAHESSWVDTQRAFQEMGTEAEEWLVREGVPTERRRLHGFIDARYAGQNFEISVPLDGLKLPPVAAFLKQFSDAHVREYGYDASGRIVEIVNCRVRAVGVVPRAPVAEIAGGTTLKDALLEVRPVYFTGDGWVNTPVYRRRELPVGEGFAGPAIVEEMSSTTVILPGQRAHLDKFGNLIIKTR
jgi:N-methylhydantoinase A